MAIPARRQLNKLVTANDWRALRIIEGDEVFFNAVGSGVRGIIRQGSIL